MLAAVILSAGQSSRMGSPKALVEIRNKTFLTHLLEATKHPKIGIVRVVLGANDEEIRSVLALPDEMVILNPDWQRGQLSSVQSAVRSIAANPQAASALASNAPDARVVDADDAIDGIILCPVDHPLITQTLVASLVAEFYSDAKPPIVVPTFRGRRGHPAIFSRSLFPELLSAPDDQGARSVVWAHATEVAEVPTEEEGVVLNLNDPEVLRRARENS